MAYLAFALWSLGEIDRAVSLIERMDARIAGLTHANTLALGTMHAAMFALMSRDRSRAQTKVSELVRILREHDLRLFRALSVFLEGWAAADAGALADGLEGMRRGVESLREQNALIFDGLIKILLSEAEALAGDPERALATIDEALATVERAGFRTFEAELRRTRGEMLLRRDPANSLPAEEAFQAAIAVARKQARAVSSYARRLRSPSSTNRPAVWSMLRRSSRPPSKGFRQRPKCPRSLRGIRCWWLSRPARM